MGNEKVARGGTESKPVGFWVKLGFVNFGGPAGQIAIMHKELVEKKRWVSEVKAPKAGFRFTRSKKCSLRCGAS